MALGCPLIVASLLTMISSASYVSALSNSVGKLDRCGGRLERALDALQRDSPRRNRLEEEEAGIVYQQKLISAPLEMTVSRIAVKLPQDSRNHGGLWARVEQCSYEPSSNALQTRVMFNDLTVSGVVSLLPRGDYRTPIAGESCRMSLRLRRAGIEFYTSPIARARGQMRIRTESSFLEPRFASIYAYGCRPTRADKQIKRHDKWHQQQQQQQQYQHQIPVITASADETYEPPEPRQIAALTKEEDVTIANESTKARELHESDASLGIWRKNVWVTKIPRRRKRRSSADSANADHGSPIAAKAETPDNSAIITPADFVGALAKRAALRSENSTSIPNVTNDAIVSPQNATKTANDTEASTTKTSLKRETTLSQLLYYPAENRGSRDVLEADFDQTLSDLDEGRGDHWQSRESVSNEMEDVFLRGASQALTRYIERELHPAIKETLMLSMGYTISYG